MSWGRHTTRSRGVRRSSRRTNEKRCWVGAADAAPFCLRPGVGPQWQAPKLTTRYAAEMLARSLYNRHAPLRIDRANHARRLSVGRESSETQDYFGDAHSGRAIDPGSECHGTNSGRDSSPGPQETRSGV